MGVGVVCPKCRCSFPFSCNKCSSYDVVLNEDFEPLKYFQNKTIYYFKCLECDAEFDAVMCPDCSTKIRPEPPFVLGDKALGNVKGCFIATACLDDKSPILDELCLFRDTILAPTKPGRQFIRLYYACSPHLLPFIRNSSLSRSLAKFCLVYPAFFFSRFAIIVQDLHRKYLLR